MNDILEFLTSQEAVVVYLIAGISCFICLVVYFFERNNVKVKQRHNTRELNKLVEQIKEETEVQDVEPQNTEPVLEKVDEVPVVLNDQIVRDEIIVDPLSIQEDNVQELQYTSIEPDMETAQLELKKITEELKKQEEVVEIEDINHDLSNYEEQQEENAIISLEELVQKSKDMYAANELSQYVDEGNEPISLKELEEQAVLSAPQYQNHFSIEEVVPVEELTEEEVVPAKIRMDDFKTINATVDTIDTPKKFKNSPIISPIFGIEREDSSGNDISLENTANYDKLDAEIKRTNEFLMTLKDLQKKLD